MKDLIRALYAAAEVYREPLTEERALAYCAILGNYEAGALVRAVAVHLRTGRRFPLPVDIIAICEGESADLECEAMAVFAHLAASNFDDKIVREQMKSCATTRAGVNACGGPWVLREGAEAFEWKRRAFVLAYKGARARESRKRAELELPETGTDARKMIDSAAAALSKRST